LPTDTEEKTNLVIQEAQGWVTSSDGRILLTANAPKVIPQNLEIIHPDCQTRSPAETSKK
jgi:hypothetical protein